MQFLLWTVPSNRNRVCVLFLLSTWKEKHTNPQGIDQQYSVALQTHEEKKKKELRWGLLSQGLIKSAWPRYQASQLINEAFLCRTTPDAANSVTLIIMWLDQSLGWSHLTNQKGCDNVWKKKKKKDSTISHLQLAEFFVRFPVLFFFRGCVKCFFLMTYTLLL